MKKKDILFFTFMQFLTNQTIQFPIQFHKCFLQSDFKFCTSKETHQSYNHVFFESKTTKMQENKKIQIIRNSNFQGNKQTHKKKKSCQIKPNLMVFSPPLSPLLTTNPPPVSAQQYSLPDQSFFTKSMRLGASSQWSE